MPSFRRQLTAPLNCASAQHFTHKEAFFSYKFCKFLLLEIGQIYVKIATSKSPEMKPPRMPFPPAKACQSIKIHQRQPVASRRTCKATHNSAVSFRPQSPPINKQQPIASNPIPMLLPPMAPLIGAAMSRRVTTWSSSDGQCRDKPMLLLFLAGAQPVSMAGHSTAKGF